MDWKAVNDIIGWAGSALLIVSLLQHDMMRLRVLNLVASVVLVAYNAWAGVWPMVGMNGAVVLINIWFIVKLRRDARRDAASVS
jgi:hypothetical protein